MTSVLAPDVLSKLDQRILQSRPNPGHGALREVLNTTCPDLEWHLVHSRKGWHRIGGVIDKNGDRIADNLQIWIEEESKGDLLDLFLRFEDKDLLATKICGTTHYLTASTGPKPWDFVQIEVDELHEVSDRHLFDPDSPPDEIEDVLSPENPTRVEPMHLSRATYQLRKCWDVSDAHKRMTTASSADSLLILRFFDEWTLSRANSKSFCHYFVLHMVNFVDRFGEQRLQATPISVVKEGLPPLPSFADRGVDLSRFLNEFDRAVGCPFAWYFCMVSGVDDGLQGVARAAVEDNIGPYNYLPDGDCAIVQNWVKDSYTFK